MRMTTGEQLRELMDILPRYETTAENCDMFRERVAELEALLEELSYRLGQYLPLIEKINATLAKKEFSE